ncbi:hypothetical protein EDC04DRAFT_2601900 [Pisolithus marmoratus]|nr:hypothetical protein EDC04DRAFT_2601900 [Pisolithus marmoratus]
MQNTGLPPSSSTMINPMDVVNHATERILEHLAAIRVVKDMKVWWDCYKAIWEQLNYVHGIEHSLPCHQWASLGVEPLPQDLEVLEREKLWSNDMPVIGESPQDVAKSIVKGKGKGNAVSEDTVNTTDETSWDIQESSNTPSQGDGHLCHSRRTRKIKSQLYADNDDAHSTAMVATPPTATPTSSATVHHPHEDMLSPLADYIP